MRKFRYEYGAGPGHLMAAALGLGVAIWALVTVLGLIGAPENFLKWFVGAIVLHDLLFLPLYSALGIAASGALFRGERTRLRIAALNHLRIPALLSGLLLLVWFPLVLSKAPSTFEGATGYSGDFFFGRWLALTVVLFAGSALIFAVRARSLGEDRR